MASKDDDRHLQKPPDRGYRYVRRVPEAVRDLFGAEWIRTSLKTTDLSIARARRDMLEKSHDDYWVSLRAGPNAAARKLFDAANSRAMSLNLVMMPASAISDLPIDDILKRVDILNQETSSGLDVDAVLGLVSEPKTSLDDAFNTYESVVMAAELQSKSDEQRRQWRKVKLRSISNFKAIVGDVPIEDISRDHALKFYQFWLERVLGGTHVHNSANRDLGCIRSICRDFFTHIGQKDRPNPFRDLSYKGGQSKPPPPFPTEWIRKTILGPGALATLNEEARGIVYALIETGCRPSEICNLPAGRIILDAPVPHIQIRGRMGREIKTEPSNRDIPLVGVSLAAFKKWPAGFSHRYGDKENSFSALAMKYFRNNDLFPTDDHVIYSFRHSFEKRALEAGLDSELRKRLMGHTLGRPDYGDGGSLEYRQEELARIALPCPAHI